MELDKLRRDMKLHTEWYWLNIYDKDGETGKQKDWQPDDGLTSMYKQILWNMFYSDKMNRRGSKEVKDE